MAKSAIEWTGETWNPTTGCTKISQGCKFCYASIMHRRLLAMGQPKYSKPFNVVVTHDAELNRKFPKKGTFIFVDSMSDLFHLDVPLTFIQQVIAVIASHPQHIHQVLTKRADRAAELSPYLDWPANLWLGTSVEEDKVTDRIAFLQMTGATVKFLSLEPLIGPLPNLNLAGIDWVIVGGESAAKPRAMHPDWVDDIRRQCEEAGVAFFFKQWGGKKKKAAGRTLNGRTYDEMPTPKPVFDDAQD